MNKLFVTFSLVSAILLSACGGGGGGNTEVVTEEANDLNVFRGLTLESTDVHPWGFTKVMDVTLSVPADAETDAHFDIIKIKKIGSLSDVHTEIYISDENQNSLTGSFYHPTLYFVSGVVEAKLRKSMSVAIGRTRTLSIWVNTYSPSSETMRFEVVGVDSSTTQKLGKVEIVDVVSEEHYAIGYYEFFGNDKG